MAFTSLSLKSFFSKIHVGHWKAPKNHLHNFTRKSIAFRGVQQSHLPKGYMQLLSLDCEALRPGDMFFNI